MCILQEGRKVSFYVIILAISCVSLIFIEHYHTQVIFTILIIKALNQSLGTMWVCAKHDEMASSSCQEIILLSVSYLHDVVVVVVVVVVYSMFFFAFWDFNFFHNF